MIWDFSEIFTGVSEIEEDVRIEHLDNLGKLVCVFGVLETERGLKIKDEMLSWLKPEYDLYVVSQKPPGKLYEYPALRFAQWLSKDKLLYVHTKGAAQNTAIQKRIRDMWKHEFTGKQKENYFKCDADVVCPFLGTAGETWYNGMFISKNAFELIGEITVEEDRYSYQRLFRDTPGIRLKGMLKDNINCVDVTTYMMTMDLTFSGKSADFGQPLVWVPKKR